MRPQCTVELEKISSYFGFCSETSGLWDQLISGRVKIHNKVPYVIPIILLFNYFIWKKKKSQSFPLSKQLKVVSEFLKYRHEVTISEAKYRHFSAHGKNYLKRYAFLKHNYTVNFYCLYKIVKMLNSFI